MADCPLKRMVQAKTWQASDQALANAGLVGPEVCFRSADWMLSSTNAHLDRVNDVLLYTYPSNALTYTRKRTPSLR